MNNIHSFQQKKTVLSSHEVMIQKTRCIAPGIYPFWFWNGQEEPEELCRQLQLIHENGCRGAVIHSRSGNRVEYLSDHYLDLIEYICGLAAKLGMKIWLYDEHGFPSGNAGGRVQKENPELAQMVLVPEYSLPNPENSAYAAYSTDDYQLTDEEFAPPERPLLRLKKVRCDQHVDTLNPRSAVKFLEYTHRKFERLQHYFGSVIEAVYTDDESAMVHFIRGVLYSPVLEKACDKCGRPLRSLLPLLVEDLPGNREARIFFYQTVQHLFLKNFIRPQRRWCREHGLWYLGHLCGDEGPLTETVRRYASAGPYYSEEDIPSVDDFLTEMKDHRYLKRPFVTDEHRKLLKIRRRTHPLLTFKLASSAAHQFANDTFSAETLAFLGWDCPPDFIQTQMLFELGMGANLITHHAYYYTIGGMAKKDCPPSWFYQQPMFHAFGAMNRRWTWLAQMLCRGDFYGETLVLYPTALMSLIGGKDIIPEFEVRSSGFQRAEKAENALLKMILELFRRHIGFDIVDEKVFADKALILGGKVKIGAMNYRTILLPGNLVPGTATAALLNKFQCSGGKVGRFSAIAGLEPDLHISGCGTEEILLHTRQRGKQKEFFLLNLSGREIQPEVRLDGTDFLVCDPIAGSGSFIGGRLPENFQMPPGSACIIAGTDFPVKCQEFSASVFAKFLRKKHLSPTKVSLLSHNVLKITERHTKVTLHPGTTVEHICTETFPAGAVHINGKLLNTANGKQHECDISLLQIPAKEMFHEGVNILKLDECVETLYLEGNFLLSGNELHCGKLAAAHGNLSTAGCPYYRGEVEYRYSFTGKFNRIQVETLNAALVILNGKQIGWIFGKPNSIAIAPHCRKKINYLKIIVANTLGNFIDGKGKFGIDRVDLLRS